MMETARLCLELIRCGLHRGERHYLALTRGRAARNAGSYGRHGTGEVRDVIKRAPGRT